MLINLLICEWVNELATEFYIRSCSKTNKNIETGAWKSYVNGYIILLFNDFQEI